MIIELFGEPGVGKSTFARALADHLHERGHPVQLIASYRPAEWSPALAPRQICLLPRQLTAAVRRLARPAVEIVATAADILRSSHEAAIPDELLKLLPPRSLVWSIRLHQYMLRLLRSWRLAAASDHIVLFDQGFVQAVSSLVLLGRAADRACIAEAVATIPAPDLLIRLTAPPEVLTERLRARMREQGRIERLFELDLQTNLGFRPIIEELDNLLHVQGHRVACAHCANRVSLVNEVRRVGDEAAEMFLLEQVAVRA